MSHNNDNSGMLYFGGMVVVVVILGFLIKILKGIMIELSLLFTAIGKMASAFIAMAWQIAQVLGLLSLGVLAIYAAWVFSKKYYRLLKDATAVKEQIENRFNYLHNQLNTDFKELSSDCEHAIKQMQRQLDDALKKSEMTPSLLEAGAPTLESTDSGDGLASSLNNDSIAQDLTTDENLKALEPALEMRPQNVTNPF
jgi:hypothetical protein